VDASEAGAEDRGPLRYRQIGRAWPLLTYASARRQS